MSLRPSSKVTQVPKELPSKELIKARLQKGRFRTSGGKAGRDQAKHSWFSPLFLILPQPPQFDIGPTSQGSQMSMECLSAKLGFTSHPKTRSMSPTLTPFQVGAQFYGQTILRTSGLHSFDLCQTLCPQAYPQISRVQALLSADSPPMTLLF